MKLPNSSSGMRNLTNKSEPFRSGILDRKCRKSSTCCFCVFKCTFFSGLLGTYSTRGGGVGCGGGGGELILHTCRMNYVCMYLQRACVRVCMYICMYVCMYNCMYVQYNVQWRNNKWLLCIGYTPRARLLNHWATKPEVCNQLVL